MEPTDRTVLDHLSLKRGPVTIRELAAVLALPRRSVEGAIQSLRLAGHAVVSDSDGIYLSDDPEVIRACAERLRHRLHEQERTANALLATAERLRPIEQLRWTA